MPRLLPAFVLPAYDAPERESPCLLPLHCVTHPIPPLNHCVIHTYYALQIYFYILMILHHIFLVKMPHEVGS